MMALLILYKWTIVAGIIAAPALALLGSHLATRDRAMQTLCVGQGAMVGVLVGIGLLHSFETTPLGTVGPFLSAIILSALTFLVSDLLVAKKAASKNTTFAFLFALLLASGYLVSSLFPALESHMAQVYFGDLATLTTFDSQVTAVVSLICLAILVFSAKSLANQSFEWAIFGDLVSSRSNQGGQRLFKVTTLVMLCLSVQFVGFLFTIAMLFLPTALMNFLDTKGLKLHFMLCAALSVIGTVVGFLLSLQYTRLPTVPAIVAVMFVLSVAVLAVERSILLARGTRKPRWQGEGTGAIAAR